MFDVLLLLKHVRILLRELADLHQVVMTELDQSLQLLQLCLLLLDHTDHKPDSFVNLELLVGL